MAAAAALVAILTGFFLFRPMLQSNGGLEEADAYYSKNDIDSAIASWNDSINANPRDARAYRQRANAYATKGDYNLAIADYGRAIDLEPNDAKARYNRGLVFKARGETARAAADFKAVLNLANDPDAERDARTRLAELGETALSGRAGITEPAGDTSSGLPNVRLAGEWSAEVTYSWGDKYTERFSFKLDGNDVLGTASFLGVRRGIREGTLNGDRLLFSITQGVFDGDNPKDVIHRYRGRISGDVIAFSILSEGGDSDVPVEFTARRER
jgi:tetratricopeptide (TPR) repeat protein